MHSFLKFFGGLLLILILSACSLNRPAASDSEVRASDGVSNVPLALEDVIPKSDYYYVVKSDKGIIIRADAASTFKVGRAELLPQSAVYLDEVASILKNSVSSDKKILIAGHTDRSGSKAANDRLSLRRAQSVMAALVQRGVNPMILSAEGFGFDEPISDNASDNGRAMNRRVEIIILNKMPKVHCLCPAFQ